MLYWVFGSDYVEAAPIAMVMLIGHVVMIAVGNPPHILAMTGEQKSVVVANIGAALCMGCFGWLGALAWEGTGLAIGFTTSLVAQHGLLWWLAKRRVGIWTHVGRPIFPDGLLSRFINKS